MRDNLHKVAPRPPLLVVQVHGERVSPKGHKFEPLSAHTLYTCESVAGRLRVRESVRYITHDSCAISVVPPFNTEINLLINIFNHLQSLSIKLNSISIMMNKFTIIN